MKNIIFTGGGSGGHVVPALTLIDKLKSTESMKDLKIYYIGGRDSIERSLVTQKQIQYKPIFTGKLRRYFSVENFIDIAKVAMGLIQSFIYLLTFSNKKTLPKQGLLLLFSLFQLPLMLCRIPLCSPKAFCSFRLGTRTQNE